MDEMFALLLDHQDGISNCFCIVGKKKNSWIPRAIYRQNGSRDLLT